MGSSLNPPSLSQLPDALIHDNASIPWHVVGPVFVPPWSQQVSVRGAPTLESSSSEFDFCFGPEEDNGTVFNQVGGPLTTRAMEGQVGVVFAYGQTGSGKTYTMNGLMDHTAEQLYERACQSPHLTTAPAPLPSLHHCPLFARAHAHARAHARALLVPSSHDESAMVCLHAPFSRRGRSCHQLPVL